MSQSVPTENPLQQQLLLQQQQQLMMLQQAQDQLKQQVQLQRPHSSFHLMAPEASNFMPLPTPRQMPAKRPSFEADPTSPNSDSENKKAKLWFEFQKALS